MSMFKSLAQFTLQNIEKSFTSLGDNYPKKLLGIPLAKHIEGLLRDQITASQQDSGRVPKLAIVLASDDPASIVYVRKKQEACSRVGINSEIIKLQNNFNTIESKLKQLNDDANTHGIILQQPIDGVETSRLVDLIHPNKDIDGTNTLNAGFLTKGIPRFIPCTPLGIYVLLRCYGINTHCTHAVILGKSDIVGSPLADLMSRLGKSSVTIVDIRMKPEVAEAIMSTAAILIVATGTPEKFKSCRKGSVVIDVGINRVAVPGSKKSKLVGDVDAEAIKHAAAAFSPVPGGIGPMTCAMVLLNTYMAYKCSVYNEDVSESIHKFLNISKDSTNISLKSNQFIPPHFAPKFKILLVSSAYNGMTQRIEKSLAGKGYNVEVHIMVGEEALRETVARYEPHLIIAPMLKEKIPTDIYQNTTTWIVHPGIVGDRGPSSIDWAVLNNWEEWGVTVLEASEVMDGGDVWATKNFVIPKSCQLRKSEIYNTYSTEAALFAVYGALDRYHKTLKGEPLNYDDPNVKGTLLPTMKQKDRAIDWDKLTDEEILRRIGASDGAPGVLTNFDGQNIYVYNAHKETKIKSDIKPGSLIGHRNGAVLVATKQGSVWIGHARKSGKGNFKQLAYNVLPSTLTEALPMLPITLYKANHQTFQDIVFEQNDQVGILTFDFYNGAFGNDHSKRLADAIKYAKMTSTKILILRNDRFVWSNGIDLNSIEASADPNHESWLSINAIDDVVEALLTCHDQTTIACLGGSAGAGGVAVAAAADLVIAPRNAILNPHYRNMGLYGSEFWTRSFPARMGKDICEKIVTTCTALTANQARTIGLVDFVTERDNTDNLSIQLSKNLLADCDTRLEKKRNAFNEKENIFPFLLHRKQELEIMKTNIFDDSWGYAEKRNKFVLKLK